MTEDTKKPPLTIDTLFEVYRVMIEEGFIPNCIKGPVDEATRKKLKELEKLFDQNRTDTKSSDDSTA